MSLFDVPPDTRVRIQCKSLRWMDKGIIKTVKENFVYEGITTNRYVNYAGAKRRLIIFHNIVHWTKHGVWQINSECEIIS